MSKRYDRRDVLKGVAAAGTSVLFPIRGWSRACPEVMQLEPPEVEIQVAPVSPYTVRFTVRPVRNGQVATVPANGSLVQTSWGEPILKVRGEIQEQKVRAGNLQVTVSSTRLSSIITITVENEGGGLVQRLVVDKGTGVLTFNTGHSPLLGLGEGGPQFDRRGSVDTMRSGQGGYQLGTHGGRVPIPWLIGTEGWAMYIHHPFGTFDFSGPQSKFMPTSPDGDWPIDVFLVVTRDPGIIMSEYARLTGHAEMPPRWSFGYQQSHRTLAGREEILAEAKTFREKKLPCDALIYLGTGFCP